MAWQFEDDKKKLLTEDETDEYEINTKDNTNNTDSEVHVLLYDDDEDDDDVEEEADDVKEERREEEGVRLTSINVNTSGFLCKALCDFNSIEKGDLSFKKGDILHICQKREDGWYEAENEKGEKGSVPSTNFKILDFTETKTLASDDYDYGDDDYADECDDGDDDEADEIEEDFDEKEIALKKIIKRKMEAKTMTAALKTVNDNDDEDDEEDEEDADAVKEVATSGLLFKAICDFKGEENGDLSFKKGDILTILQTRADGWFKAENDKGEKGSVPSTFIKSVVSTETKTPASEDDDKDVDDDDNDDDDDDDDDDEDESVEEEEQEVNETNTEEEYREGDPDEYENDHTIALKKVCKRKTNAQPMSVAVNVVDDEDDESDGDDEEEDDEDEDESEDETRVEVTTSGQLFKAMCDFKGEDNGDLSFKKGDILTILQTRADGWFKAENDKGEKGSVPSTFIKSVVSTETKTPASEDDDKEVDDDDNDDDDDEDESEEEEEEEVNETNTEEEDREGDPDEYENDHNIALKKICKRKTNAKPRSVAVNVVDDEDDESDGDDEEEDDEDEDESEDETRVEVTTSVRLCKAICDFNSIENGDLSFKEGDILHIFQTREDGWYEAKNEKGERGSVPSTFLKMYNRYMYTDVQHDDEEDEEEEEVDENSNEPHKKVGRSIVDNGKVVSCHRTCCVS